MHSNPQRIFILFLCLIVSVCCFGQKKVPFYDLDNNNGLLYKRYDNEPFNGVATGEHSNGQKKLAVTIKDGKLDGSSKEWAKNGQIIYEAKFSNGIQTGTEVQWYEIGIKKLEVNYVNGKTEGICTEWFKNGNKKSEGLYKAGLEEDKHEWWFDTGEKDQIVVYKSGKPQGIVKNWYKNGQLKLESNYVDGQREGQHTEWFEMGQKKLSGTYKGGKEDGTFNVWSKSGKILGIQKFRAGEMVEDINYRSGNILLDDGYLQVFNEKESFFTVKVNGDWVRVRNSKTITFSVDGMVLQMFTFPIDGLENVDSSKTKEEILEAFVANESAYILEKTEKKISPKKSFENEMMVWSFEASVPEGMDVNSPKFPLEEHYVSIVCNKQVLSLYSVATKGHTNLNQIPTMLKRIAGQVKVENDRIDLNEKAKSVQK